MRIMALEIIKDEIVIIPDKHIQTILTSKDAIQDKTGKDAPASDKQVSKKMISICGLFTLPFTPYQLLLFFVCIPFFVLVKKLHFFNTLF